MSVAALITTGLAGMVWFMSCQTHGAAAGPIDGSEARAATVPARPVTVRTAEIRVHEITPDLIAPHIDQAASAPARRAQASAPSTRTRVRRGPPTATPDPLPRRLARAITGDGRYEVRPFPTVPPPHR